MLPIESKRVQRAIFQAMSGRSVSSSFLAGKPLSAAAATTGMTSPDFAGLPAELIR
jgi:hypothetical protein